MKELRNILPKVTQLEVKLGLNRQSVRKLIVKITVRLKASISLISMGKIYREKNTVTFCLSPIKVKLLLRVNKILQWFEQKSTINY